MTHGYELYLRVPEAAQVEEADLAREQAALPSGIRCERYPPDPSSAARGLDVTLVAGCDPEEALEAVFALGARLGLEVFDPQLGATVTPADCSRIAARCRDTWAFRSETLGEVGPEGISMPPPAGRGLPLWVWVALGALLAVILLGRTCRALLHV